MIVPRWSIVLMEKSSESSNVVHIIEISDVWATGIIEHTFTKYGTLSAMV